MILICRFADGCEYYDLDGVICNEYDIPPCPIFRKIVNGEKR